MLSIDIWKQLVTVQFTRRTKLNIRRLFTQAKLVQGVFFDKGASSCDFIEGLISREYESFILGVINRNFWYGTPPKIIFDCIIKLIQYLIVLL